MKLIKEILYEDTNNMMDYINFTNDSDPIKDMKIGAKELIEKWIENLSISNCKLTKKNTINVYNYVLLDHKNLKEFPSYIKFNHIVGGFHINNNDLSSLRGCPYSVTGSFMASENNLINLIDGPTVVKESYGASYNKLESLEGIAEIIGGSIYLAHNNLKTLEYIPSIIYGDLFIENNPIETLKYFPDEIDGNLFFTPSDILSKEKILEHCQIQGHIVEV